MRTTGQALIEALRTILIAGKMGTQEEICEALTQQGFSVNQSKVSRLLRKLVAVKTMTETGQITYHLPREPVPLPTKSPLTNLVIEITNNEMTVVIRTLPGAAHLIARLLDYNAEKIDSLGTVAGDDTILLVPKHSAQTTETVTKIKHLLSDIKS